MNPFRYGLLQIVMMQMGSVVTFSKRHIVFFDDFLPTSSK